MIQCYGPGGLEVFQGKYGRFGPGCPGHAVDMYQVAIGTLASMVGALENMGKGATVGELIGATPALEKLGVEDCSCPFRLFDEEITISKNIIFLMACIGIAGLAWVFFHFFGNWAFAVLSTIGLVFLVYSGPRHSKFGNKKRPDEHSNHL